MNFWDIFFVVGLVTWFVLFVVGSIVAVARMQRKIKDQQNQLDLLADSAWSAVWESKLQQADMRLMEDVIAAQSNMIAKKLPLATIQDAQTPVVEMPIQTVILDVVVNDDPHFIKLLTQLNLN